MIELWAPGDDTVRSGFDHKVKAGGSDRVRSGGNNDKR